MEEYFLELVIIVLITHLFIFQNVMSEIRQRISPIQVVMLVQQKRLYDEVVDDDQIIVEIGFFKDRTVVAN